MNTKLEFIEVARRRARIRERLAVMPPLSHWPDHPASYSHERSEVLAYILALFPQVYPRGEAMEPMEKIKEANRLLNACSHGCKHYEPTLTYDHETRLWRGVKV